MVTTRSTKLNRLLIQPTKPSINKPRSQIRIRVSKQKQPNFVNLPTSPCLPSPKMANQADAMMAPRGLPIVMPPALAPRTMPMHLPKFSGFLHQDPSNHIEGYIETLVTNVIPEDTYRLVWFSTTLEGPAYEWYRSHAPNTFADWPALQAAFLRQFKP